MKRLLLKTLKLGAIIVGSVLALMFLLPIIFPGAVETKIKAWTNQSIKGELNFSKARLSFFRHFPTLTLSLHDFSLTGSSPFEKDTLMAGKNLSFGINLSSLFRSSLKVDQFFVDEARIRVEVDEKGNANYNIYKGSEKTDTVNSTTNNNTKLQIERILISDCQLSYNDRSLPMRIEADGFNYEGKGDLASEEFDLQSGFEAASFDFHYGGTTYLNKRRLKADLVTSINTSSLAFRFQKNSLLINKLPVDFSGGMTILKDGYDIDLHVVSGTTDFGNIFSILPPDYEKWFQDTKFAGTSKLTLDLTGAYKAATETAPDLRIDLTVKEGSIQHKNAPVPLNNFGISATLLIPRLQPDSLRLKADSIRFTLNGRPTTGRLSVKGMTAPDINTAIKSELDLALFQQALGLSIATLKGQLLLDVQANGRYQTGQNPKRFRPDTIVLSIPSYTAQASLQKGYFKYRDLPLALENVQANIRSDCAGNNWESISLLVDQLSANIGMGKLQGRLSAKGLKPTVLNADLKADLPLETIQQAIPLKGYRFGGKLLVNINADGLLDSEKKSFPTANATIEWTDGLVQTPYYPNPVSAIRLTGKLDSKKGSYDDLNILLDRISFQFENQPFEARMHLNNLNNLRYDIAAKGTLDLTKLYRVFAVDGYRIKGLIKTELSLKGSQADAMSGRYQQLQNSGHLDFQELELLSDMYPSPFLIPAGRLTFKQDKAWLEKMILQYRENSFYLNGYAQNLLGYYLQNSVLKGKLSVLSDKVKLNDFMVFSNDTTIANGSAVSVSESSSGVVLLPDNLNLLLEAKLKSVQYGETDIKDFSGSLSLSNGKLQLRDTHLGIAGAFISLSGNYAPVDTRKAVFDMALKADSFDVQRAYKEVPIFREMASSAEKAAGIISLKYTLAGRLDDQMKPVFPSLTGGGELRLEQVKIKGLKLFGAVSRASGKDSINNPNLKAVIIKSGIRNNIVTIERTKMKAAGFRLRAEGQSSLDGKLNLHFRVGLPPLGIIGIPMTIKGSTENPIVKIRKARKEDELQEENDEQQEP